MGSDHLEHVLTDILIIGCGIAGSVAALTAAEDRERKITIVTGAEVPWESNTYYAQGGIIGRGPQDTPELLVEDLMRAGDYLNHPKAVDILAREGPKFVEQFLVQRLGVEFASSPHNALEYIREAAHSTERILHVADATGRAIEERLVAALKEQPNINILTSHTAVDLLTPAHHSRDPRAVYDPPACVGAYVLDQDTGQVRAYLAGKTILATGGLGQIYLHTTNPERARGDGLAMAHRAGARIINAQYVQFHPTAFYRRTAPRFLISETVRGAGARLVNARGEPFMHQYDPYWKDLAPRDVVARSIHREMLKTRTSSVYLDLKSVLPSEQIKERFPTIYAQCLEYGVDITQELIPVVPAAHYFCGGAWVDAWGRTNIQNLYAVGEVSCTGVHGANRLGSASLLEGLVWGHRAGRHAGRDLGDWLVTPEEIPPWRDTSLEEADPALIRQDVVTIQHIMWNYVGLVRSTRRLERALDDLTDLQREIHRFYRASRLTDGLLGLRNAVEAALIVAQAAWEHKESHGCHYRED